MSPFNVLGEMWKKDVADSISEGFAVHASFVKKEVTVKMKPFLNGFSMVCPLEAQNKDLVASYLLKSLVVFLRINLLKIFPDLDLYIIYCTLYGEIVF